jgi:hypothetical protein
VPPLADVGFVRVEISATGAPVAAWEQPIVVHFRRTRASWRLVGLVRMP